MQMLEGFDNIKAIEAVLDLAERKLLLLDWEESTLILIVSIDEGIAWPMIRQDVKETRSYQKSQLLPRLTIEHQLDLAREWIRTQKGSYWDWDWMVDAILRISAPSTDLLPVIQELSSRLDDYPSRSQRRKEHRDEVTSRLQQLERETEAP